MEPGTELGNYVLDEQLDQGGRGEVWLAHREFAGGGRAAAAIKFPHVGSALDPEVRDRLLEVARLQMQMQHSNIPRVIDMGVHEELPYYVMGHIAGHSLAQLLARLRDVGSRLRFELVAHIAREIAYALRYAHGCEIDGVALQVIHRDLTPKSVLISSQGAVYVTDFGVSEAMSIEPSRADVGSLLYVAPEQAKGFPTAESDGWGLGAIMWEMIEGRRFRGEAEAELRHAVDEGRHEPLGRVGIPEALRFVTEGLLRVDERERLTLDEVLRPLETPEFPAQRTALADLLERCFGGLMHPAGQMLPVGDARPSPRPAAPGDEDDGEPGMVARAAEPPTSDAAIATAGDDETASEPAGEADPKSLPPPPAWNSMSEPVVRSEPAEPRAADAAQDPEPKESPEPEESEALAAAEAAPEEPEAAPEKPAASPASASTDPRPSRSAKSPTVDIVPTASSGTAELVPAAPPRKRSSPVAWVAVLGLVCVGIGWAAWPRSEASSSTTPAVAVSPPVQPVPEAKLADPQPGPDGPQLGPDGPQLGPDGPQPPEPQPPEPQPLPDPPDPVVEPVVTPVPPEPTPTVEPSPKPDPTPRTTPKTGSNPPRKQTSESREPVKLAIELLLMADMELEVNGTLFSLGLRKAKAKTTVPGGTVRVRWRRPFGKWKSKKLQVEGGKSYELLLDDRGPSLRLKK